MASPPIANHAGGACSLTLTEASLESNSPSAKEIEPPVAPPPTDQLNSLGIGLGAWSKPLNAGSSSSPVTVLMQTTKDLLADLSSDSQWPTLSSAINQPNTYRQQSVWNNRFVKGKNAPSSSVERSQISREQASEYPWAAKMEQSKRNLHLVTKPVYLEDGTPKVTIPRHVLLEGVENQKEFVLGQFYRCSAPSSGLVQSIVSRIWGKRCCIYTRKLGDSSFLFHIPDELTRKWVTQRGFWHVDDCMMFTSAWNPAGTLSIPEISSIPVWLTLKEIPHQLYSKKGISWIASGIGAPMLTSKPWLDPILMGEAKILVEVKLDRPFPQKVAIEDESGSISMVTVIYSWIPSKCSKCGELGHKAARCLGLPAIPVLKPSHPSTSQSETEVANRKAVTFDSQGCILLEQESNDSILTHNLSIDSTEDSTTKMMVNDPQVNHSITPELLEIVTISDSLEKDLVPLGVPTEAPPSTADSTAHVLDSTTCLTPHESLLVDVPNEKENSVVQKTVAETVSDIVVSEEVHQDNKFAPLDSDEVLDSSSSPPSTDCVPPTTPLQTSIVASVETTPTNTRDPFEDFRNGIFLPQEAYDETAQRSRGGRHLRPSQKLKETDWYTIVGRGRRGRGHHGGRGPPH